MAAASVIGRRIRMWREELGISRESFCDMVGITQSALSMYENGQRIPRDEIKIKIAKVLRKSIEAIFFTD